MNVAEKMRQAEEAMNQVTFDGYTRPELVEAFDMVCDPDDWKGPINARITRDRVRITRAAIEFFTATRAEFEFGLWDVAVKSIGYRMGPAGP